LKETPHKTTTAGVLGTPDRSKEGPEEEAQAEKEGGEEVN
jgi:hypothetical protein